MGRWASVTSTQDIGQPIGQTTMTGVAGQSTPFVRVNQAFLDAQTRINSLRIGKTFVDVINYVDYEKVFAQGSFTPRFPEGFRMKIRFLLDLTTTRRQTI